MDIYKVLNIIETLCHSRGKLEAIIESSLNAVIEIDSEGFIVSYNPVFITMFNLDSKKIDKLNLKDICEFDKNTDISCLFDLKQNNNVQIIKTVIKTIGDCPVEKFFEYKFLSIPEKESDSKIIIISDKSDVMAALKNREYFIETLFDIINELKIDNRNTIYHLAKLVELKDPETGKHLERVEEYTRIIAQEYKKRNFKKDNRLTDDYVEDMALSSVLHDIGKIGISDIILNKKGKLNSSEFELIKQHTVIASEALREHKGKKDFLAMGREIALAHHEKWDGTGYPQGLKGLTI